MFFEPWDYSSPPFSIIKTEEMMMIFFFFWFYFAIMSHSNQDRFGCFYFCPCNFSWVIPEFSSGLQNCRFLCFYHNSGLWMFAIFIPFSPSQWRQYYVVKNSWMLVQDKPSFETWFHSMLAWICYLLEKSGRAFSLSRAILRTNWNNTLKII